MNVCPAWKDRLLEHALGTLAGAAAREVETHLNACSTCAAAFNRLRAQREQMDVALRQLVQGAEPAPDFRARAQATVASPAAAVAPRPAWAGAWTAVAVVLLVTVLLPWLGEQGPARSGPNTVATLSEWRSPTEALLRTPGDALLWSTPRMGEIYFAIESPPATTEKENGGNNES